MFFLYANTCTAYLHGVPTCTGCLPARDAYCPPAWGAYLHGVPTCTVCLPAWGAYLHGVPTCMRCLLAWGAYLHGVPTCTVCLPAWGAYLHRVWLVAHPADLRHVPQLLLDECCLKRHQHEECEEAVVPVVIEAPQSHAEHLEDEERRRRPLLEQLQERRDVELHAATDRRSRSAARPNQTISTSISLQMDTEDFCTGQRCEHYQQFSILLCQFCCNSQ